MAGGLTATLGMTDSTEPAPGKFLMPVIAFANPKGGSGKTTSALLLATVLAMRGASVRVIDADPERHISRWGALPGRPENLSIETDVSEDTIMDTIEAAEKAAQFVIVDLEGTASLTMANTVAVADFVIVPLQGSGLDATGAAKMLRLIKTEERKSRRPIPYAILTTRTSAAVMSRSLRNVLDELSAAGAEVFNTGIVERAAFRDMFDYGGPLEKLDPSKVNNIEKAIHNAREFAGEVLTKLKAAQGGRKAA